MARTGWVAQTSGATVDVVAAAAAFDVSRDCAFRGTATRSGPEHAASTTTTATIDVARNVETVTSLTPTCVWRATPDLVIALDDRFGEPVDAYVNGSQVWLRDEGPGGITLEWRLHPVPGYRRPSATGTYEVFEATALALATGAEPPAPLERLWDGLEVFAAYGDEVEPATLAAAAADALGIAPDASGLVDHERIGDDWERTSGGISVVDALFGELGQSSP